MSGEGNEPDAAQAGDALLVFAGPNDQSPLLTELLDRLGGAAPATCPSGGDRQDLRSRSMVAGRFAVGELLGKVEPHLARRGGVKPLVALSRECGRLGGAAEFVRLSVRRLSRAGGCLTVLLVLGLMGCPRNGVVTKEPAQDPVVGVFDEQLGSRWYGLYRDGHKVGWLRSTFRRDTFRGDPALIAEGHAEITTRAGAAVHTTAIASRHLFDAEAPHELLRYRRSTNRGGVEEWRELRPGPGGSGWVAVSARAREPETARPADLGDYTLARFLALERWVADGPGLGDVVQLARLDTSTLSVVPGEASVVGVTHTVIDAVSTTVYSLASFESGGAAVITRYDGEGRILAVEGGEVDLRLEDEQKATALDTPRDLFLDALITPTGLPLRGADTLTRLLLGIPDTAAALIPAASGQRVLAVEGGYQIELVRGGLVREASEAEQIAALRSDARHPLGEPRVGRLLGQALPPRTNPRDRARLLAEFVRDYLEDDRSAEPLDLSDVIDRARGDCTEHTTLFVTLARAAGLPAREVGGLLWVSELGAFGGHAWAEVALEGRWVPVDPTWGQMPADPAHIRLADTPHLEAAARRALRSGGITVIEAR